MPTVARLAEIAGLIGDPARANMLVALKEEGPLAASTLALVAGVSPSTASGHLAKLAAAWLIDAEPRGRHRFYRLACAEVVEAIDLIGTLAARTPLPDDRRSADAAAFRCARRCFDHLAGALGSAVTRSLLDRRCLLVRGNRYVLAKRAIPTFAGLGIDIDALHNDPRPLTRVCRDWSEKQPHLGGALGGALFERSVALGWIRPRKGTRAVSITRQGRSAFRDRFGVEL